MQLHNYMAPTVVLWCHTHKKTAMNHSGEGGVQFHTLSGPDIFFLRQLAVLDEFFSV